MQLQGIPAIITGGASGLGGATAELLAAGGAKVTILDRDRPRGEAKAAELGAKFFQTDVTDEASVANALEAAEAAHGIARILVNCAGIGIAAKTVDREGAAHNLAKFSQVISINLIGTFSVLSKFAARLAPADLIGEERGVIINTASVAAYEGQIGQAAYSASKGGVVAMTLPIARDLSQMAIRVVTIAPGIFLTPMMAGLPQAAQDSLGKQVPFPSRLGQPSEYAHLAAAIIANPMLNGETIRLDGAIRMSPR
jgi:NAD(P)-dependent dehydrogenase (short-subunit alcohol dehydrogenase family)